MINIGDIVKVKDWGESYSCADDKALIAEPSNYSNGNTRAFLLRTEALINIAEIHHMTIEEIEDELGYPIEIIE